MPAFSELAFVVAIPPFPIQQAISELCVGKTLLVIAHRLNTIRNTSGTLRMSVPRIKIFPDFTSQNRASRLAIVVFPPPEGPTSAVISLFGPLKALYGQSTRLTVMNSCMDRIEEVFAESELPDMGSEHIPAAAILPPP